MLTLSTYSALGNEEAPVVEEEYMYETPRKPLGRAPKVASVLAPRRSEF
jgi:hypothetical protein